MLIFSSFQRDKFYKTDSDCPEIFHSIEVRESLFSLYKSNLSIGTQKDTQALSLLFFHCGGHDYRMSTIIIGHFIWELTTEWGEEEVSFCLLVCWPMGTVEEKNMGKRRRNSSLLLQNNRHLHRPFHKATPSIIVERRTFPLHFWTVLCLRHWHLIPEIILIILDVDMKQHYTRNYWIPVCNTNGKKVSVQAIICNHW